MTLERVEKGYTWRMMKATNWYVTCEIYRKIWMIRKLMNQREAWYAPEIYVTREYVIYKVLHLRLPY